MVLFTPFHKPATLDSIFFKEKSTGSKVTEENSEVSSRSIRINLTLIEETGADRERNLGRVLCYFLAWVVGP